jgi:hypothetical protein
MDAVLQTYGRFMLRACIPFEELLLTVAFEGQHSMPIFWKLGAGQESTCPTQCGPTLASACHPAFMRLVTSPCQLQRHTSPCCILACGHLMNTPIQYVSNHLLPAAARCVLPQIFLVCHPAASCRALLSSFLSSATSACDASSCDLSPATSCSLLASLRALQAVGQSRPGSRKVIKRLAHCAPLLPFSS